LNKDFKVYLDDKINAIDEAENLSKMLVLKLLQVTMKR